MRLLRILLILPSGIRRMTRVLIGMTIMTKVASSTKGLKNAVKKTISITNINTRK